LPKLLEYKNYKGYLFQWLKPFGFSAWEDIYNLVEAQSGKQVFQKHILF
jgi:tRNA(Ile)-lysidine synthase